MPNKSGSNRVGWNQRGPTDAQMLRDAQERSDPESYHWQNKTRNYKMRLCEVMGDAEFEAWADRAFPGDTIDDATWKQIAELYAAKLHIEEGAPDERECERHDWKNNPKHYKTTGE
jgi:outer membrane biogenesis lipoprotein LolB